jgi:ParB/RepB/Spo0J family partition protein
VKHQYAVQQIAVSSLIDSPFNQGSSSRGDVKSLAESIKAQGLLQPIMVFQAPGDTKHFQIIFGHRRAEAHRLLGLSSIPAIVREDIDAAGADYLTLVENLQRENLDPIGEAHQVAALLARFTVEEVAASTGRSANWIRIRASLANLIPAFASFKFKDQPLPVSHLEFISRYPASTQELILTEIKDYWEFPTLKELQNLANNLQHVLSSAPWPLQSLAYNTTKAIACADCPKRSSERPSLFPELSSKKDSCLDPICWAAKLDHYVSDRIAAESEAKSGLLLVHDCHQFAVNPESAAAKRSVSLFDYSRAKKSDKGAVPALAISGPSAGQIMYLKPNNVRSAGSSESAPAKKKTSDMSLKEKMAGLTTRRIYRAVEIVRVALDKNSKEAAEWIRSCPLRALSIISRLGVHGTGTSDCGLDCTAILKHYDNLEACAAQLADPLHQSIMEYLHHIVIYRSQPKAEQLERFVDSLYSGTSWSASMQQAEALIPVPKSWSPKEAKK